MSETNTSFKIFLCLFIDDFILVKNIFIFKHIRFTKMLYFNNHVHQSTTTNKKRTFNNTKACSQDITMYACIFIKLEALNKLLS